VWAGELRLRAQRTEEWLRETAERAHRMLAAALPPLCSHLRPAVRQALAEGAQIVALTCPLSLISSVSHKRAGVLYDSPNHI